MISFLEKHKELLDRLITTDLVNDLIYYEERGWFLQLLKEYGIVFALILLEYYKQGEEYLNCKKIIEAIEHSNKYFGTTYPLNLKAYENMSQL